MVGGKSTKEKKRKNIHMESRHVNRKRRSTESSLEDPKEEQAQQQGPDEASNTEEGGLDLNMPIKPISAYITDRDEMLEQCFRVLGEDKLKKMMPDELKSCSFEEIKRLCLEQLEQLSESNLLQILEGEEVTGSTHPEVDGKENISTYSQQDNNVDSTSSFKENPEMEDLKQGGGSGEDSDVLSINADDSDIEGHKDEPLEKTEEASRTVEVASGAAPAQAPPSPTQKPNRVKPVEQKKEIQKDIEKSVNEILALVSAPSPEETEEQATPPVDPASQPIASTLKPSGQMAPIPSACLGSPPGAIESPSAQQLELLELEMRARAIKALMKANEVKKKSHA